MKNKFPFLFHRHAFPLVILTALFYFTSCGRLLGQASTPSSTLAENVTPKHGQAPITPAITNVLLPTFTPATEREWRSIGPNGGYISTLTVDPRTPTTIYAGTASGGMYKSEDGGESWNPINQGLTSIFIYCFAVDPTRADTLYVGTDTLFQSTNGGRDWHPLNLDVSSINVITVDPTTPTTLFVGTHGGIYKTMDEGATWHPLYENLPIDYVYTIDVDPKNPDTVYVVGGQNIVWKSVDGGSNWIAAGRIDWVGSGRATVQEFVIDPETTSTIYAMTLGYGIFKSTDAGANWFRVTPESHKYYGGSLVMDPHSPSRLYFGSNRSILFSQDRGVHWYEKKIGAFAEIQAIAINPIQTERLYVGTYGDGVLRSEDDGESWRTVNNGLHNTYICAVAIHPTVLSIIYVAMEGKRVLKTTDGGRSWREIFIDIGNSFADISFCILQIDPHNPEILYVSVDKEEIYKSLDGGESWRKLDVGTSKRIDCVPVTFFTLDPLMPTTLFWGSGCDGLHKSADGGEHWYLLEKGLAVSTAEVVEFDPADSRIIYVAVSGDLYKSVNGGVSWYKIEPGIPGSTNIEDLVIDPNNTNIMYAVLCCGDHRGVYKSSNGGENWWPMNDGLSSTFIRSLAIDPITSTTLYAGTWGSGDGVYRSLDGGKTWHSMKKGLTAFDIPILEIDPNDPGTVYAGTEGGGIFVSQ